MSEDRWPDGSSEQAQVDRPRAWWFRCPGREGRSRTGTEISGILIWPDEATLSWNDRNNYYIRFYNIPECLSRLLLEGDIRRKQFRVLPPEKGNYQITALHLLSGSVRTLITLRLLVITACTLRRTSLGAAQSPHDLKQKKNPLTLWSRFRL